MTLAYYALLGTLFFAFVVGAYSILPSAASHPIPGSFVSSVDVIYLYFASFNSILPVREFLDLFLLSCSVEIAIWFFYFARWLITIVRGARA